MEAYCGRQGVDISSIRFLYDGQRVQPDQTPKEVKILSVFLKNLLIFLKISWKWKTMMLLMLFYLKLVDSCKKKQMKEYKFLFKTKEKNNKNLHFFFSFFLLSFLKIKK